MEQLDIDRDHKNMRNMFAVCVSRNLMLKVSILGVLCYHWLGRVAVRPQSDELKVTNDLFHFHGATAMLRILILEFGVSVCSFFWDVPSVGRVL